MSRGRFITFEGGEGAGKTTQLALLADRLRAMGITVVTSREPGGSPGGELIRKLLVDGDVERWDAMTEALLHFAARRDHLVRKVWPAMAEGAWVISDRFADSTLAYQGYGHGLPLHAVQELYSLSIGAFAPDLTLILDLPAEDGLKRAMARGGDETRYERMDLAFHQRLRQGFLDIAKSQPERCHVLSAMGSVENIHDAVMAEVRRRLID